MCFLGKVPGVSPKHAKNNTNKIKTEKIDVISNAGNLLTNDRKDDVIDKLPIEPDKQKLNIFKKISSKTKEDKERDTIDHLHKMKEFGFQADSKHPLINAESYHANAIIKNEDKIIQQVPLMNNSVMPRAVEENTTNFVNPGLDSYDMSPCDPRTLSTPKTPEIGMQSPVVVFEQQKRKKKDKSGKKKEPKVKTPKNILNPTKKVS